MSSPRRLRSSPLRDGAQKPNHPPPAALSRSGKKLKQSATNKKLSAASNGLPPLPPAVSKSTKKNAPAAKRNPAATESPAPAEYSPVARAQPVASTANMTSSLVPRVPHLHRCLGSVTVRGGKTQGPVELDTTIAEEVFEQFKFAPATEVDCAKALATLAQCKQDGLQLSYTTTDDAKALVKQIANVTDQYHKDPQIWKRNDGTEKPVFQNEDEVTTRDLVDYNGVPTYQSSNICNGPRGCGCATMRDGKFPTLATMPDPSNTKNHAVYHHVVGDGHLTVGPVGEAILAATFKDEFGLSLEHFEILHPGSTQAMISMITDVDSLIVQRAGGRTNYQIPKRMTQMQAVQYTNATVEKQASGVKQHANKKFLKNAQGMKEHHDEQMGAHKSTHTGLQSVAGSLAASNSRSDKYQAAATKYQAAVSDSLNKHSDALGQLLLSPRSFGAPCSGGTPGGTFSFRSIARFRLLRLFAHSLFPVLLLQARPRAKFRRLWIALLNVRGCSTGKPKELWNMRTI